MESSLPSTARSCASKPDLQQIRQAAVEEERKRLAQEIHDTLAQAFAGIAVQAAALEPLMNAADSRSQKVLAQIMGLARSGLEDSRRAIRALRPRALEGTDLPTALERLAHGFSRQYSLSCGFCLIGRAHSLHPATEDELFCIAREALNNVRQHSQADSCSVCLECRLSRTVLTIRDNGVGFRKPAPSTDRRGEGLAIMRERARRIGAHLELRNDSVGGVVVRVSGPTNYRTRHAKRH